jgi:CheY-like chemotaxis protein
MPRRFSRPEEPDHVVAMSTELKDSKRSLPATPRGLLPSRLRALHVSSARRTGAWLAEAFASDSACEVALHEAAGAAAGLEHLREQSFDAVLVSHEPGSLDALEFVEAARGGGTEEPLIIVGEASDQQMSALCFEAGGDAYVCAHTATTRTLLWIVARAAERHQLLRENRRLLQAERHRLQQEHEEADRLLGAQHALVTEGFPAAHGRPLAASLVNHYREILRAHVMMGCGNLSGEMATLAQLLVLSEVTAPQTVELHVQVLEELVRGLGNRSARHVMSRADLLLLEILLQLAEKYRQRAPAAVQHSSEAA